MATHIKFGRLFTGLKTTADKDQTVVVDGDKFSYVGPSASAPKPAAGDKTIDQSRMIGVPGMVDVHVHLTYGNAMCEEDIDLYAPIEFRALRGLINAQRLLAAGYTSMADPGGSNRVPLSIRNAINAGLFPGPRISCSGPYITSRQGLTDWYPTWFGAPKTSIGHLVTSMDEAIEEIRTQVKDGVDYIKIAMDGIQRHANGDLLAAFNQDEITRMTEEAHRLGKKVITHARGRESTLSSARAGVDLIFHASWMDDECLDAMLEGKCAIGPTLTLINHAITFLQPSDPGYGKERYALAMREWGPACEGLPKAHKAGVPFMTGTDSGFSGTPYGEWHAKEMEIFVKFLGFTPGEALRSGTAVSAGFLTGGDKLGAFEKGRFADFIVFDGDPLADIAQLLDKTRIKEVWQGGAPIALKLPAMKREGVSDFSYKMWNDMYSQARVAELTEAKRIRSVAAE